MTLFSTQVKLSIFASKYPKIAIESHEVKMIFLPSYFDDQGGSNTTFKGSYDIWQVNIVI